MFFVRRSCKKTSLGGGHIHFFFFWKNMTCYDISRGGSIFTGNFQPIFRRYFSTWRDIFNKWLLLLWIFAFFLSKQFYREYFGALLCIIDLQNSYIASFLNLNGCEKVNKSMFWYKQQHSRVYFCCLLFIFINQH